MLSYAGLTLTGNTVIAMMDDDGCSHDNLSTAFTLSLDVRR